MCGKKAIIFLLIRKRILDIFPGEIFSDELKNLHSINPRTGKKAIAALFAT